MTAYELIAVGFPGWGLQDMKRMTIREREFWAVRVPKVAKVRRA